MARRSDDDQRCRRQLDVLVVDDHRTFADALCIAIGLQGDMSCRAAARSAEAAFAEHPEHAEVAIERPVFVHKGAAVIGRPPERVLELL